MDAIQISRFDGSDALEHVTLPAPKPQANEVLVNVRYCGVNFADLHRSRNEYLQNSQLPFIPGAEIVGVRADNGERVLAYCGTGGYAEQVSLPEHLIFTLPETISDETALALFVQGVTAWFLLTHTVQLKEADTIVIHSAAGGTGSLLLTLSKQLFNVKKIIGTSTSAAKLVHIQGLGADAAVLQGKELTADLIAANDGKNVDVVFDAIGGSVFEDSFAALAPFGRMVVYGISSREVNNVRTSWLLRKTQSVVGFWFHSLLRDKAATAYISQALEELFAAAAEGKITPTIGGVYALKDAALAHNDLAQRKTTGKLLLNVAASSV